MQQSNLGSIHKTPHPRQPNHGRKIRPDKERYLDLLNYDYYRLQYYGGEGLMLDFGVERVMGYCYGNAGVGVG